MPDRPFQDPASGDFIMAKPNLTMQGRTAGSPDNARNYPDTQQPCRTSR
jgi:hypothetical protein